MLLQKLKAENRGLFLDGYRKDSAKYGSYLLGIENGIGDRYSVGADKRLQYKLGVMR